MYKRQILTCDIDPEATAIAQKFFARSPHGSKIDLRFGPALETMATLNGTFDLVFIDADKLNYVNYYERAMQLLSSRGVILVDNVLWNGDVLIHPPPDGSTQAIQELNQRVAADPRVSSVLLTIRDGLLVITPKLR